MSRWNCCPERGFGNIGTGLVACRLAVECGKEPAAALRRVRAAGRRAVETAAQEAYVMRLGTGGVSRR